MSTILEVARGVFRISVAWGNVYVLWEAGEAAFIDTGLARDRPHLIAGLQELGIRPDALRSVLLTHAHCDHAGSAAFFSGLSAGSGEYRARLHVHRAEVCYLAPPARRYPPSGMEIVARPHAALAFALGEHLYPVERAVPHVLLEEGDVVSAPGGELVVIETPGHTPGHVSYYRPGDGVLFSGDAILNIIPIKREIAISLPMALFTYDMPRAVQSARRLTCLLPKTLLSGHGPPVGENTADRLNAWIEAIPKREHID